MSDTDRLERELERLLARIVDAQERRLLDLGRRIAPAIAVEDLHAFDDVPALRQDPHFVYEDGVLAGMLTVETALRAYFRDQRAEAEGQR